MKWCMECGEAGKPEPATTAVEGDPLCAGCAKARGVTVEKPVFNDEFVNRRMAEHKASVEPPSAPKEKKVMATCACGCGGQLKPDSVWNYLRGHKKAHKAGEDVPKKTKTAPAGPVRVADNHPDPDFLDTIWNALPDDHKRDALRAVFDAIL